MAHLATAGTLYFEETTEHERLAGSVFPDSLLLPEPKKRVWSVVIRDDEHVLARGLVQPAAESIFVSLTQIEPVSLSSTAFVSNIWIDHDADRAALLPALLYLLLRRASLERFSNIVALDSEIAACLQLKPLEQLDAVEIRDVRRKPAAARLKRALSTAFDRLEGDHRELCRARIS